MAKEKPYQKIGATHALAMGRQGLAELRDALSPFPNVPLDLGIYGNATPGEIAEARQPEAPSLEAEQDSTLGERLQQANQPRDDKGHDDPGMDRE